MDLSSTLRGVFTALVITFCFVVHSHAQLTASSPNQHLPWCYIYGSTNVTVTTTGGTSPYQYSLSHYGTYQSGNTFYGVAVPAILTIWVSDAAGDTTSFSDTLTVASISIYVNVTNATGPTQADGSATVVDIGGLPPLTLSWIDSVHAPVADTGLLPGLYSVNVIDSSGCDTTLPFRIGYLYSCTNVYDTLTQSICSGDSVVVGTHTYRTTGSSTDTLARAGGCDSIVTLTLTVNTLTAPMITLTGSCLGYDSLMLTNLPAGALVNWYRNDTIIQMDTVSDTYTGFTVAGGSGPGYAANELDQPSWVWVDSIGNIYVSDQGTSSVRKFPPGSTSATNGVTAAGGSSGSSDTSLTFPSGLFVDAQGSVVVSDDGENRIQQFPAGSSSSTPGVTVVGGNGLGSASDQLHNPQDVFLDAHGYIYVCDASNYRVVKFPPGSTSDSSGVIVAGGNYGGSAANQLNNPIGIFIDALDNLYIADAGNNRVQKFPPGSDSTTNGVTVAGGNGFGPAANQVLPEAVWVDAAGYLYASDGPYNRIQRFPPGSTSDSSGVTVAGGIYGGSGPNQLSQPEGIYLDQFGSVYVADVSNYRIQKFVHYDIYRPTVPGSYTATYTMPGACTSAISDTVVLHDTDTPSIIITVARTMIYSGASDTFIATPTLGGPSPSYHWYKSGVLVGTNSATFITRSLSNNDSVSCVMTSNAPCASPTVAVSNQIHITVSNACTYYNDTFTQSICSGDSFLFGGWYCRYPGYYTLTYTDSLGCDSVSTLNLLGMYGGELVLRPTICHGESYTFDGTAYSADTAVEAILPGMSYNGCDSTISLVLSVAYSNAPTMYYTICTGDSLTLWGRTFYNSGFFVVTTDHPGTCDTIYTFGLNVLMEGIGIFSNGDTVYTDMQGLSYYQWLLNDQPIPGANGPIYIATRGGSYKLIVRDSLMCTDTLGPIFGTGIADIPTNSLHALIYPNPNQGSFTLQTSLAGRAGYVVYDILGNVVLQKNISSNLEQINLTTAPGIYTLVVKSGDGSKAMQIIIEN